MAPLPTRAVVLLPIQPQYATPIMDGTKRVEFRKRGFGREVSHVVVYSSSPVKQVVGFFEILGIEEDSPRRLWRRYAQVGGIDKEDYDRYFSNVPSGVAIKVGSVHVLREPVPLAQLKPGFRAPQSYAYLSEEDFAWIRSRVMMGPVFPVPGAREASCESSSPR
jgi:predicted transcriptional regulator